MDNERQPAPIDYARDYAAFGRLAIDSWTMWYEAAQVVWLRSIRLAGGGAVAEREASRMVSEKIVAPWELAFRLAFDPAMYGPDAPERAASRSVRHYRTKVRANRRRLAR